jgi:hypothetical protein
VQKTSSGTDKGKGSSSSSSSAGKSPQKKVEKTKASAPEKKHNVIYKSVHRNFSESKNQALQNFLFKTRKQNSLRNMKCKNTNLARPKRDHSICTERSLPIKGRSNSFMDKVDDKGNLITRRFYDKDGRVKRDIDFTDHGYPKFHPQVPHKHEWDWSKNPRRGPWTQ